MHTFSFCRLFCFIAASACLSLLGSTPLPPLDSSLALDQTIASAQSQASTFPSAAAWTKLGESLTQKHRDTQDSVWVPHAEAAYRSALEIDPGHVPALNGLAWVFGSLHQFPESVRWAKKALEIDPENPDSNGIIGDAAVELGDLDRAFECYQLMLDARPDQSSYSRSAHLVWLSGNSKKGRWLMQKAIDAGSIHPENTAWCRTQMASMLFHDGSYLAASQCVAAGLAACPGHLPLLLVSARIHAAMRNETTAIEAYEQVIARQESLEALAGLADLHAAASREVERQACITRIEELHRNNEAAGVHDHSIVAKIYANHDLQPKLAASLAREHGNSLNVYDADLLAWALYKNGDIPAAMRSMKSAMRVQTPDAEIFYHAGMIAKASGDTVGARKLLARALSLNPHFNPLQSQIATQTLDLLSAKFAAE